MNTLTIQFDTLEELAAQLLAHAGAILVGADNIPAFTEYIGRFDPNTEKGGEK